MAPILLAAGGFLSFIAAGVVSRILLSLGIGVVSYVGMSIVTDYAFSQITSAFNDLPALLVHFAAVLKVDVAVNMIMGAVTARFGLFSLNGIVSRFQIDPSKFA